LIIRVNTIAHITLSSKFNSICTTWFSTSTAEVDSYWINVSPHGCPLFQFLLCSFKKRQFLNYSKIDASFSLVSNPLTVSLGPPNQLQVTLASTPLIIISDLSFLTGDVSTGICTSQHLSVLRIYLRISVGVLGHLPQF